MSHSYRMYSVGNMVSKYVVYFMVTYSKKSYCSHHFEMYKHFESLYCVTETNTVLWVNYTSKTNEQTNKQTQKKRSDLVTRGRGQVEWKMDEGSQKVQPSSYKINKN